MADKDVLNDDAISNFDSNDDNSEFTGLSEDEITLRQADVIRIFRNGEFFSPIGDVEIKAD